MSQVKVQHFMDPNFGKNADLAIKFISDNELKRDQIISLCQQETQIEEGNSWISLFYRTEPVDPNSTPFDEVQYKKFNNMTKWDLQIKEMKDFIANQGSINVVGVTHTPRNNMGLKNFLLWFSKTVNPTPVQFKYMKEEKGNMHDLIKRAGKYLNDYISPHQLISIDFFEESHPNEKNADGDQVLYCCISHTAGDEPTHIDQRQIASLPAKIF